MFWTAGEAVPLPLPGAAVHDISTDGRKDTCFGLPVPRHLGFYAGPAFGGSLLETGSARLLHPHLSGGLPVRAPATALPGGPGLAYQLVTIELKPSGLWRL